MRFFRLALLQVAMALLAANALAQPAFDPAARAKAIEPYISADTLLIIHVDMARLDWPKIEKWVMDIVSAEVTDKWTLDGFKKGLEGSLNESYGPTDAFKKAGGTDLYMLMTVLELDSEPLRVIPLAPGADADALSKLLAPPAAPNAPAGPHDDLAVALKSDDVLLIGTQAQLDRIKQNKAAPLARPELARAFEAAGDSTSQFVLLPAEGARQLIEQSLPQLPPELGGGPSTAITKGISWATLATTQPPQMQVALVIQSPTPEAAKALADVATSGLQTLAAMPDARKNVPNLDQLLALLKPVLAGDRVSIVLDDAKLTTLLKLLIPSALKAQQTANSVKSMSNEKLLLQGGLLYANEHNGEWPEDLAVLIKSADLPASAQINPFATPGEAGYIYIKPAKNAGADVIVIYETKHLPADRLVVGFADGHVDTLSREEFEQKLKPAK